MGKRKYCNIFCEETRYKSIKSGVCVSGNTSKHIFIQHDEKTKNLFVDNQNIGISIPAVLLDANNIHYKPSANGNALLSISNQGHNVHVTNLETKQIYDSFNLNRDKV